MLDNKRGANGDGTFMYDEERKKWRYQFSYRLPNGKLKRKSVSGNTKTEVKRLRKQFELDLAQNLIVEPSKVTLVDLLTDCDDYDYSIGVILDDAYARRRDTVKIIQKSAICNVPITSLTEDEINAFLYSLKSRYSDSVIGKVYSALSKGYKLAMTKKILNYNLMDSPYIKRPASEKKTKKITAFTVEEQNVFLEELAKKRFQREYIDYDSMLQIELFAGLRMGEVSALTPEDIDFKHNVIKVRNTITRDLNFRPVVGDKTKTEKGYRDVPISPLLTSVLKYVLDNYEPNKEGLLFYNKKMDRPVSTQQVNCYFRRLCEKANIMPQGGQHLLRHTYATRCIESGVPAPVLKNWMGHKDISVTINTYCDVFDRMQNKELEKFTDYCNNCLVTEKLQKS